MSTKNDKKFSPAKTPKERLNQLTNLAYDSAEERLRNGTASSQIITALLTMSSDKQQLEIERLQSEVELAKAKIKQMDREAEDNKRYIDAINAFKNYRGEECDDEEDLDDYDDYSE